LSIASADRARPELLLCKACGAAGIRLPEGAPLAARVTCKICGAEQALTRYRSTTAQLMRVQSQPAEPVIALGMRENMRQLVHQHHARAKRNGMLVAVAIAVVAALVLVLVMFARP
jgi:hypothetical protein